MLKMCILKSINPDTPLDGREVQSSIFNGDLGLSVSLRHNKNIINCTFLLPRSPEDEMGR